MKFREKTIASGIHFSASLLVFSAFLFILLKYWYPEPLFTASGGLQGLKLVILVDLILGPLLTFILFDRTKSLSNKIIDYGFILFVQIAALVWGINTVYEQRPVALVFWDEKFYTVPDHALLTHYKDNASYHALIKASEIPLIYAQKPQNMENYNEMMRLINEENIAPHHQITRYSPMLTHFSKIKSFGIDIREFTSKNTDMKNDLEKILNSTQKTLDELIYIPLESKYQNIVLIFDPDGNQLGFIKAPYKKE